MMKIEEKPVMVRRSSPPSRYRKRFVVPHFFTRCEGGRWIDVRFNKSIMKSLTKSGQIDLFKAKDFCHSLLYGTPLQRWDCENGHTGTYGYDMYQPDKWRTEQ